MASRSKKHQVIAELKAKRTLSVEELKEIERI